MFPPLIARNARSLFISCGSLPLATLFLFFFLQASSAASFAASSSNEASHPATTGKSGLRVSNFAFQCGIGDTQDCEGPGGNSIVWPSTQAQPGTLRLHDAGTHWSTIDEGNGVYNWTTLDQWLDLIAQHQPVKVIQTFTWVPCYLVGAKQCLGPPTAPSGTNVPPGDLTANGSPAFNAFVTAFVQHCSPNGNCVSKLIKAYEMWNEWDINYHWTGTMEQVYQMIAPAVAIIRANVPNALILTPSATPDSDTAVGYQADFQNWLNYENEHGRISDWVDWHVYLSVNSTTTNTPEVQWEKYSANYLAILASTPGWETTPWVDTETNFNGAPPPGLNYTCPAAQYTPDDCTGQIVRWQLLHASNGARGLAWYKWNSTIGLNSQYETAYQYMMQYLNAGTFPSPCSVAATPGAPTWTCTFTESNGTKALWVWTPSESGMNYMVPSGYADYRDLKGGKTNVSASQIITIGVEPIMLEAGSVH
ncbi:MAG TPA: hypothetical protein VMD99_09960 [Terriglobales bacterium]|nr:hypothetical protein [Terriglobales bacterium]